MTDSILDRTVGTLYLTPDELELFEENYTERDEAFYIPRTADVTDVGPVRPVIATKPLIKTHYILTLEDYRDDDWTDAEFVAEFEHREDPDIQGETYSKLEVKLIEPNENWAGDVEDALTVMSAYGLDDGAIAAILNDAAQRVQDGDYDNDDGHYTLWDDV